MSEQHQQPQRIVCSLCGHMFREPLEGSAAVALREALLNSPVIAHVVLGREAAMAGHGVCSECYRRLMQWAQGFGLKE